MIERVRVGDVVALARYIDWRVICEDINQAIGVPNDSHVRIAGLLNLPPSTVQRWIERKAEVTRAQDIGYAYGEALLELHRLVCGQDETLKRLREFKQRATKQPL